MHKLYCSPYAAGLLPMEPIDDSAEVLKALGTLTSSLLFVAVFLVTAAFFVRGAWRLQPSIGRQVAFWSGMAIFYVSLHTRVDYYAEHQFAVHRLQHLALHHLAPLLVMAAYPGSVIRAGLPLNARMKLRRVLRRQSIVVSRSVLLHPSVVTIAFLASIVFWLVPSVQFVAMLDWRLYFAMNWSVAVTGLMYWWMVVDHRQSPPARLSAGMRVMSPIITMTPQILLGSMIAFSSRDLYPIFTICGRAFTDISAEFDQSLGGLIMWIPAAVLEAIGALLALRRMMHLSERPSAAGTIGKRPAVIASESLS
ncbi:cytochrome c oxidase assembly protein [Paraburkholderia sp. BL6665CI2N2]|uniref:cytochrome c oxidase assembly protein n=1 Tax=Paraburkholderia sp. BL6665CI2N2 TaxID=1938806 RepID=UPI001FBA50B9|nr:cytochrome c oxidase assembly protein [Paraburkholderia sp. BL6665CI2N2]